MDLITAIATFEIQEVQTITQWSVMGYSEETNLGKSQNIHFEFQSISNQRARIQDPWIVWTFLFEENFLCFHPRV